MEQKLNREKVEVFKTSVREDIQAAMLIQNLRSAFPKCKISFDLEDCDKVLRVEGEVFSASEIIKCLNIHGFDCQILI